MKLRTKLLNEASDRTIQVAAHLWFRTTDLFEQWKRNEPEKYQALLPEANRVEAV